MESIQEELWNIFTFYTLHGNPKDPSRLNRTCLLKLCRDVMVSTLFPDLVVRRCDLNDNIQMLGSGSSDD